MKFRGETLAAVALCGCLAVSGPAIAASSYEQTTKYDVDISGSDLLTALPALSRQTGVVVLYPYQLAQVRSNPVKGLYTVPEVLQLMLQGTGFSGDVSAPVCAQQASAQAGGTQEGTVESVTVTGSRVISDIANSPTPLTVVSTEQ